MEKLVHLSLSDTHYVNIASRQARYGKCPREGKRGLSIMKTGEVMFRKLMAAAALTSVLVMTGCASVPMASKDVDMQAKAFTPAPDKATVYIYRNEVFGSAIKMPVLIDNVSVGDTASKTYIEKQLPPGSHTVTSKTEHDSSLTIDMLAGQIYYIWQEVKMGAFAAGSALHVVDEKKGQAGVRESKLVQ